MNIRYRKRVKIGDGVYVNITGKGVSSISHKVGNVTINSKRGTTINYGNGLVQNIGKNDNSSNDMLQILAMQQLMSGISESSKNEKKKSKKKNGKVKNKRKSNKNPK